MPAQPQVLLPAKMVEAERLPQTVPAPEKKFATRERAPSATPKTAPAIDQEPKSETFFISGQVNKAGIIAIPKEQPITVSMTIAIAGGPSRLANLRNVILTRTDATGATKTIIIDVKKAMEGNAAADEDPIVQPGDKINVPESMF